MLDALARPAHDACVDLGCGEGTLAAPAAARRRLSTRSSGIDVSHAGAGAWRRSRCVSTDCPRQRERVELLQGSLIYRDERLAGFDAAALVEVIEHLDPPRLAAFERVVFGYARPAHRRRHHAERGVQRALFPTLPAGALRHRDHRFEWTRAEFAAWASGWRDRYGYTVAFLPVGDRRPRRRAADPDGGVHG